jgi:hypothetical protein
MATIGEGLLILGQGIASGMGAITEKKKKRKQAEFLIGKGPEEMADLYGEEFVGPMPPSAQQVKKMPPAVDNAWAAKDPAQRPAGAGMLEQAQQQHKAGVGFLAENPDIMKAMQMRKMGLDRKPAAPMKVTGPAGEQGAMTPETGAVVWGEGTGAQTKHEFHEGNLVSFDAQGNIQRTQPLPQKPGVESETAFSEAKSKEFGMPMLEIFDVTVDTRSGEKTRVPTGQFRPIGMNFDMTGDDLAWKKNPTYQVRLKEDLNLLQSQMGSYYSVKNTFKPEYLTFQGKAEHTIQGFLDFFGKLSEEDKAEYEDRAAFYAESQQMFNAYVKSITGAQMSELEVPRYEKAVPNNHDTPTEFMAKLERMEEITLRAAEHKQNLLNELSRSGYSYDKAEEIAARSAREYLTMAVNSAVSDAESRERGGGIVEEGTYPGYGQ